MENPVVYVKAEKEKLGKKFSLSIISMLLISAGLFAAPHSEVIQTLYTTFVGGVIAALGAFCTGNVAATHVALKHLKKEEEK